MGFKISTRITRFNIKNIHIKTMKKKSLILIQLLFVYRYFRDRIILILYDNYFKKYIFFAQIYNVTKQKIHTDG